MRCESPLTIKIPEGTYVTDGNGEAYYTNYVQVPCGKCFACLSNLRSDWTFRLKQHLRNAHSAYFVTLTYSDEALYERLGKVLSSEVRDVVSMLTPLFSLEKERLKKFFHEFRNNIENEYQKSLPKDVRGKSHHRIKYFAVGEYGDETFRPHYHFILFDYKYDNIRLMEDLENVWKEGHIDIRYCSDRLCSYITKYMLKSFDDSFHLPDVLEPPFRLVSKSLGISFVTPHLARYLMHGGDPVLSDGTCKRRVPRYYREKLSEEIAWQRWLDDEDAPFYDCDYRKLGSEGIRREIFSAPCSQAARRKDERYFLEYGFDCDRIQMERYSAYKRNSIKLIKSKKSKI